VGASATSLAGLSAPVRDIITTVESVDGTETQQDTRSRRTVILDSKVLFPEDRATLSAAARDRLRSVARQIVDSKATGTVKVDGYTDDQGSAQHGLVLSRQRARAVRGVLTPLVAGSPVRIAIRGLGEANPRVPNADKAGRPIPANQAKNRRVEISFAPGR
jgi:outer membrane protein OmpA-like peptidoglycan-associated protein